MHFYKRYDTIQIFESFFTSHVGHFIECDFDANIIPYDFYRDSDFIVKDSMTVLEKYLKNPFLSLPSEYHFPNYTTQFLVPNGDISNLLLQILFQDSFDYKKSLAIKKINYVYNKVKGNNNLADFEDIFTRFFLRNVAFLRTLNRIHEIEYIQNKTIDITKLLSSLPRELSVLLFDIIENSNSPFNEVYQEICAIPAKDTFKKSCEMIDKIKVKK